MKHPLDGIRILLVEDDPDGLEVLELFLKEEGAIVTTATTGAEARKAIATTAQDVLISDLSLPDEDGCTLLASIRASSPHRKIPAIALTGHAEDAAVLRAIKAGFDRHMAKPAELMDLAAAVRALASRRGHAESEGASNPSVLPEDIAGLIGRKELKGLLACLNRPSPYRFSSLTRIEGQMLLTLAHFDRETSAEPPTANGLIAELYRLLLQNRRTSLVIEDATADPRIAPDPTGERVRSHCGVPITRPDGTVFGWICHYDLVARPANDDCLAILERVAKLLGSELRSSETTR